MTEIINLNKIRKTKLKQLKKTQAIENRVIHGLPGAVRKLARDKAQKASDALSGNRLTTDDDNKKG